MIPFMCILVSLSLVFVVYAANGFSPIKKLFINEDGYVMEGSLMEQIERASRSQSADKLITTTYDENMLEYLAISPAGELYNLNRISRSLYATNAYYPVEYLQKINSELIYAVYRISSYGQPCYMYCFFQKIDHEKDAMVQDETEIWWMTGRAMFSCKELSHKDFETIQVGSALQEVAEIDPMAIVYRPQDEEPYLNQRYDEETEQYVEELITPPPTLSYEAYHYLTDGILQITYSRNSENEEYTVSNIQYSDSYEMIGIYEENISIRIQSKDFPNSEKDEDVSAS